MPRTNLWGSARRARLHLIVPIVSLLAVSMMLPAHQEISAAGGEADWGDFTTGALIGFLVALPLLIYSTLKGPLMEANEAVRRRRESRNMVVGPMVLLAIYVLAFAFLRDSLQAWSRPSTFGALAGFLIGTVTGILGVWLYHHLRGSWPPDTEND